MTENIRRVRLTYSKIRLPIDEEKEWRNLSREKKQGTHRRKKVDEKSCVTFLLCPTNLMSRMNGKKTHIHTHTHTHTHSKQPIMRIEDRLFDRGWVRSAMATRKCGNVYFPNYFMAVRPFLTRKLFQELFGLEG